MTDRRTLWDAAVSAAAQVLHAELPAVHIIDRQQIALTIARVMLEKLDAAAKPSVVTAQANLDAFIAAFDALGVRSADIHEVDMVDRIDHTVVLGVSSRVELAALAAELDLSALHDHNEGGYAWTEAFRRPERGTSITVQMHLPKKNRAA